MRVAIAICADSQTILHAKIFEHFHVHSQCSQFEIRSRASSAVKKLNWLAGFVCGTEESTASINAAGGARRKGKGESLITADDDRRQAAEWSPQSRRLWVAAETRVQAVLVGQAEPWLTRVRQLRRCCETRWSEAECRLAPDARQPHPSSTMTTRKQQLQQLLVCPP